MKTKALTVTVLFAAMAAWGFSLPRATAQLQAQEVVHVSGEQVAIYNLAGQVEVVRGSGSDVVVRIQRGGADAAELRVETGEIRGRSTLRVVYPGDEIVYPEMGRGSRTTLSVRDDGTFGDGRFLRGDRVRVHGSGSGLEAWADLVVEVPAGQTLAAYVGVGRMEARGLEGEIELDSGSGGIVASDITGPLSIDTGSGGVEVAMVRGLVRVDTGSGSVVVRDVVGPAVEIDTGSGSVDVSDVAAGEVVVDTGSGGVDARGIDAPRLRIDTGSGSVELAAVASRDVDVDTGSGSIELDLLSDVDRLVLDTGSGSITVRAPAELGGMIEIETGSGGIDFDLPVETSSVRRDRVRGRLGDGEGTIRMDTGSGSVRLLEAGGAGGTISF